MARVSFQRLARDASVLMPDSPSDPIHPPKSALPAHRAEGEKPRAFADQAADTAGGPDDAVPLKPPPPGLRSPHSRDSLPTRRKKERGLPAFTPAPYQAEQASGLTPALRAELPGPRNPGEPPKSHLPHQIHAAPDPAENMSPPGSADPDQATAQSPAAPRPINHRLGENRTLEFVRQGAVEVDPEVTGEWGAANDEPQPKNPRTRPLVLWVSLLGLPLVGLALWLSMGRPGTSPPPRPAPVPPSAEADSDPVQESRQAAEVVTRFLGASTIDDLAAFVRHPEVTKPRMEQWYSDAYPLKPRTVREFRSRSFEQTIDGLPFLILSMVLDDHVSHYIAVEKTDDGGFLVDWESFVFWSVPRWHEFLSKEPDGAHEFRVIVNIDTYFNYAYSEATEWFCYKLLDPENWAHCWGYCPIDSETGLEINRIIRRRRQMGESQVQAILKLKFDEAGKGRNQVLIEEVVKDGWIKTSP